MLSLNGYSFLFNYLVNSGVSPEFLPHLLEGGIFLNFLAIIGPFYLVFILSFIEDIPPVLLLELVLDFLDVFVGIVEDIDCLYT
jgi:hypothetical protein